MQTGTTPINNWYSVAYGNGVFVAVGDADFNGPNGSNIATSTDGVTWTQQTSPNLSMSFYDVVYNNGIFVAVVNQVWGGSSTGAATSPDGVTWTLTDAPVERWTNLTYGNGKFVAVSDGSDATKQVMTSEDGNTWTRRIGITAARNWTSITYGNGKFVAVGKDDSSPADFAVMTSTDGEVWTTANYPTFDFQYNRNGSRPISITYGTGKFVLWSSVFDTDTQKYRLIAHTSSDATTWQVTQNLETQQGVTVHFDGENFVALSNDFLLTSQDGTSWTSHPVPAADWMGITYFNGLYVAVDASGKVMKSGAFRQPEPPAETPSENETAAATPTTVATATPVAAKVKKQDTLPETGSDSSTFALIAGLFVAGGAVLALRRRIIQ